MYKNQVQSFDYANLPGAMLKEMKRSRKLIKVTQKQTVQIVIKPLITNLLLHKHISSSCPVCLVLLHG